MRPAKLFQDGMVLQREKPVRIWGTACPGERVEARIQGRCASGAADEAGRWELVLPPLTASREETLVLSAPGGVIVLRDVAVGEVWAACGQSNMEFPLGYEKHRDSALEGIADPGLIRFYDVPKVAFPGQQAAFDYAAVGFWRKATPEDAPWYSAIGFYFAKELQQTLEVPVGIVGCNWGGTRSAVWMPAASVQETCPLWMENFRREAEGINLDAFLREQRHNPANDHGRILNPGNDAMLPVTVTMEDFQRITGVGEAELLASVHVLTPEKIPGSLYTHMVQKLAPYTLRGILWYQGESDDEVPGAQACYGAMLQTLIRDWRRLWGEADLPFLVMELANFRQWICFENHGFAAIRRGQREAAKTERVWLCANTDAGEERDIHPKDKRVPAHRLALLARGHIYGDPLLCDAPEAVSAWADGNRIKVLFRHAGDGLQIRAPAGLSALKVFVGETSVPYHDAVAGDLLVLTIPESASGPFRVEYGQETWFVGGLYNSAGLPAFPFAFAM